MNSRINFTIESIVEGHHKVTYRGIKMIKNPFDYLLYQMLINEIKPDVIIEIGTNHGGSALYMADMLDLIGKGRVLTVDIMEYPMSPLVINHPRIKRFTRGVIDSPLFSINDSVIMVIDDASHMYGDVKANLEWYKNVVSIGSYLIVEDGILNEIGLEQEYDGGPTRAINEFLQENDNYIVDKKWCDFFGTNATFNPDGFLLRVK